MEKWALKIGLTLLLQIDYAVKGVPLASTSGEGVPLALRSGASPATGGVHVHSRTKAKIDTTMGVVIEMKVPPVIEMKVRPAAVQTSTDPVREGIKRWFLHPTGQPGPAGQAQLNLAGDLEGWEKHFNPISSARSAAADSDLGKSPRKSEKVTRNVIKVKLWFSIKKGGNARSRDRKSRVSETREEKIVPSRSRIPPPTFPGPVRYGSNEDHLWSPAWSTKEQDG